MSALDDLMKEILDEAGLDAEDLVDLPGRIAKISWPGTPDWEAGKPVANQSNLVVVAIFASSSEEERVQHVEHVEGDNRIYIAPIQSLPGDSFSRFTLNRSSPAALRENFSRARFIIEVSRELRELSALEDAAVGETCPNADCEAPIRNEWSFCPSCGTKLPEEGAGDEEEEETEPVAGATETIPAPGPSE